MNSAMRFFLLVITCQKKKAIPATFWCVVCGVEPGPAHLGAE
jgi:hypothetical protein